ncbi:MAG: Nramp family divalent metal transporter [Bacteroidales bacterium]|nr:Nramp family divalent metal transporter [Bacteroidales bacterium]
MTGKQLIKVMGPGLLYAGAAIGVSHLVQSTRAGAGFGFELVWIIIIANILKYPFFEFAPRYTSATGENLIRGYEKIGKWAVWLYAGVTIASMFVLQSGVTIVTAGLLGNVFGFELSAFWLSVFLLIITMVLLIVGRYSLLDKLIKYVIVILALSTVLAVFSAYFKNGYHPNPEFIKLFSYDNPMDVAFLIAFFGWMPGPIDISIWQSIWAEAKAKETKVKVTRKEAMLDFKIGYFGTAFLALGFLSLGALVMYGSGEEFSGSSLVFAGQLIKLFTSSIGPWAYPVIATAALATMFSTTLTCFDAYSRVMVPTTQILIPKMNIKKTKADRNLWFLWMAILFTGTVVILGFFVSSMKGMVDFATTLSFVLGPVLAILNYMVVTSKHMPQADRPKPFLKWYAIISMLLMTSFSLFFIVWRFF